MTGAALPILFKGTRAWPVAFQLHRVMQVLGMLFIIAGLALGAKLSDNNSPKSIHKGIGIGVFALVWLQASPCFPFDCRAVNHLTLDKPTIAHSYDTSGGCKGDGAQEQNYYKCGGSKCEDWEV